MKKAEANIIYTIGHSTRSLQEFVDMLQSFSIKMLVDIRSLPGSRRFPQFDKENLSTSLPKNNMQYIYLMDLGGRRKVRKDSKNNRWNNASFRGYADYMETDVFKQGISKLEDIARNQSTAYMCSEAVWWRCHRSMVSDYLKAQGWKVLHIMGINKAKEHSYTSPARIVKGQVCYSDKDLFSL